MEITGEKHSQIVKLEPRAPSTSRQTLEMYKVNGAGDFSKFYSNIYGKRVSWIPDKSTT